RGSGTLLFEIDPRPYQAKLDRAQGEVTRALANREYWSTEWDRLRRLYTTRSVSLDEVQKAEAQFKNAEGELAAAQSNTEGYRLDLEFCKLYAPISGTVSREFITLGNLVNADVTKLTNIVRTDAMHAYFDVDERIALEVSRRIE